MPQKNIKLFRKIRNYILEEPRRYEQTLYKKRDRVAPCKTAACIAGTADILAYPQIPRLVGFVWADDIKKSWFSDEILHTSVEDRAQQALGLSDNEASILFDAEPHNTWPEPFASRWKASRKAATITKRRTTQARIAADFINRIIRTGKVT